MQMRVLRVKMCMCLLRACERVNRKVRVGTGEVGWGVRKQERQRVTKRAGTGSQARKLQCD